MDDLTKPLGLNKTETTDTFWTRLDLRRLLPKLVVGALGACVALIVLWIAVVDDPFGGEPKVVVAMPTAPPPEPENPAVAIVRVKPAETAAREPPAKPDNAGKTVTIIDGSSGKREEVTIGGGTEKTDYPPERAAAAGDQRLLESTRHGLVPKIADDGTRPSDAYAKRVAGPGSQPRIAIVVSGLGIGSTGTNDALGKLPPAVTLAFAPYGTELERATSRARSEGHEILLQLPMEPYDYPDSDPGPQTLLTSLSPDQNVDRLYWQMSRFKGYVGVVNYMGTRFTATEGAFAPMLHEIAKRGLLYVDDGASQRSLAGQIAGSNNLPFAKADLVIDAVPTAIEIGRALAKLETIARAGGVAVGVAGPLPLTIDRIAQWAKGVQARGITLVPISAAAVKAKSS